MLQHFDLVSKQGTQGLPNRLLILSDHLKERVCLLLQLFELLRGDRLTVVEENDVLDQALCNIFKDQLAHIENVIVLEDPSENRNRLLDTEFYRLVRAVFPTIIFVLEAKKDALVGMDEGDDSWVVSWHVVLHVIVQVCKEPIEELLMWSKVSDNQREEGTLDEPYALFFLDDVTVNLNMADEEVKRGTNDQVVLSRV